MRTFLCPFPCKNPRIEGIPRALVLAQPCLLNSSIRDTKKELLIVSFIEDFKQPSWFYAFKQRLRRLVSLAQQLSLAAQAAYKIEDFKQPSLVFARVPSLFEYVKLRKREVCEAFIPCFA